MEEYLKIEGLSGKRQLSGEISVKGAKNAILKIICASFLFENELKISNAPRLKDVLWLLEILENMGYESVFEDSNVVIKKSGELSGELPFDMARKLRSSIVLLGPVLARVGYVKMPFPGGDKIGLRPVDLFLEGLKSLGAEVTEEDDYIYLKTSGTLKGSNFFFKRQSVTATESVMMAAVLAEGETVLGNVAMEPEIVHLANFLNKCGADIEGAGTPFMKIKGTSGKALFSHSLVYNTPPDRIEASSFLALSAVAGKDVTITNCNTGEMLAVLELYKSMGLNFEYSDNTIHIFGNDSADKLQMLDFVTHEYPGFPTDVQAPTVAAMTQMSGEAHVFESIFADRFGYVESLRLMGSDITQMDLRNVIIKGPRQLKGMTLRSIDIRAGLAYIIAATCAQGTSKIEKIYHIDRGYEDIEGRLSKLGLNIERIIPKC